MAGVGGRVGLKGSDGAEVVRPRSSGAPCATRRGAHGRPSSASPASRDHVEVLTWPGEMGEDEARAAGFEPRVLGSFDGRRSYVACELERVPGRPPALHCADFVFTTADDTALAARDLLAAGVDLILFAGGDGTARTICDAVGDAVPVIGVPAGVKIHSAVYATTPAAAGDVAALYLHDRPAAVRLREGEVMDIDEDAFRENRVSAHLYGYLTVPYARDLTQSAKAGGVAGEERALNDVAEDVVRGMEPDALYVIGPGTTTRTVMERLGLPKTLLGVDAVRDRRAGRRRPHRGGAARAARRRPRRPASSSRSSAGRGTSSGGATSRSAPPSSAAPAPATSPSSPRRPSCLSLEGRPLLVDTGDAELDRGALRLRQGRHRPRRAHHVQGRALSARRPPLTP